MYSSNNLHIRIINLHRTISTRSNLEIILAFVAVNLASTLIFSGISYLFSGRFFWEERTAFASAQEAFITVVLFAPIVETLIFQFAIIEILKSKFNLTITGLISAIVFGVCHFYNGYYIVFTFLSGLMLAYIYMLKDTRMKRCLITGFAHTAYNLLGFAIAYF